MQTFEFSFVVGDLDPHRDDLEDIFYEAGCDDATIVLMHGALAACFMRSAVDYKTAVLTAYEDVLKTGGSLKRFEPDFLVSAPEIADRAGMSRQAIHMYERGERGEGFPAPFARVTTKSPLWDWVEVSRWLFQKGKVGEEVFRTAQISRIINFNTQADEGLDRAREEIEAAVMEPVGLLD